MKLIKTFTSLPMAVAAAAILAAAPLPEGTPFAAAATAQEQKEQETRKVPALSLKVHKQVQKAQEAMDVKDLASAKEILADVLDGKVNDYERAVVWQMTAMISFEEDDTAGTIRAYEQILRYRESIPVALEMQIIYGLGQLYYSEEDYDNALKYIKEWESRVGAEFVGVAQLTFISQLHYVRNEFPQSINYIDRAIAMAQTEETIEVKENWYSLKLSAHWELGQFPQVRDTLETMLISWPKPQYWIQLAGVYQELGDEEAFYSLLEAAYKQGFLDDKEAQLINVAQIQQSRAAPIKCAWILKRAMKEDRVEESAQNLRTLGQCYMMAAEFGEAIAPLKAAAEKETDPDLWLQVGQVQMSEEDLAGAVVAFDKAIDAFRKEKNSKADDKAFTTMMLKAQALIELKRYKEARDTFQTANRLASDSKQKRQVRQWRDYLKAEEAREQMLTGQG